MKINNTKNNVLSYVLIIISLFILLIFTKNYFFNVQVLKDEKMSVNQTLETKKAELARLNTLKDKDMKGVSQFTKKLQEDEIVDYLYWLVEDTNTSRRRGSVAVKQLSLTPGVQNDLGFMESKISLNVEVETEAKMIELLDKLLAEDAEYKFFIDEFSYEVPETTSVDNKPSSSNPFTINIPLRFFYK